MQAKVKKWIVQLASGANVATILVMLAVGYSDRLNPAIHPNHQCCVLSVLGFLQAAPNAHPTDRVRGLFRPRAHVHTIKCKQQRHR